MTLPSEGVLSGPEVYGREWETFSGREIARENGNGGAGRQRVESRGIIGEHWVIPS
ncbi:MAG: hypothetical protein H6R30_433 [Methanomicrobia archaeon]|nr:hypothetical protein [Methanomicrobia archaeon]MDD1645204.1 hypothetical protein [Methanomicrobiales archaeon]